MGIDAGNSRSDAASLRRHAEEQLKAQASAAGFSRNEDESQQLLYELQIHQIELEMQNAELRMARDGVEKALGRYANLYDFAPISYFTFDRNFNISAVNICGSGLLGVERSGLIGRNFGQFVAVDNSPAFAAFLNNVLTSQGKETCELSLLTGRRQLLFVQIEAVAVSSGQECLVAVIDMTERKQAEAENQRLASFLLMNPNPVLELAANGQMTFCNPAAKQILANAGYDNDISPLIPRDMPVILRNLQDKKAGQFIREIEINDSVFEELIYIAPPFQSVRIYTMDITERKRAEEKLEILNTELEAFNYTVSHDLRTPLTVINSYCQVIGELCCNSLDIKLKGYIREMYEGTLSMNRLINTLLDFSRVSRVEIHHDRVALSKMAEEVALELKKSDPESRVIFRIAPGITVDGDAGLLRVVLVNLIGNAWKYIGKREGAVIEFGVTEVEGKPACFIRDNGPGFDKAVAEKLFIPFQRLPGTEVEGNGIGLATVERIVRRHGGKVWAESEAGNGAAFFFTLE